MTSKIRCDCGVMILKKDELIHKNSFLHLQKMEKLNENHLFSDIYENPANTPEYDQIQPVEPEYIHENVNGDENIPEYKDIEKDLDVENHGVPPIERRLSMYEAYELQLRSLAHKTY